MIIADENLHGKIIQSISDNDFLVYPIAKLMHGITDKQVLEKADQLSGIVITEDKDFGELVFAYNLKFVSIIFLRYNKSDLDKIIQNVLKVLGEINFSDSHKFVTITSNKIRIKSL